MIKILHLYYDLMNLYGEYGNLVVLCGNLKNNNIEYSVDKLSIKDEINFNNYDFIYCGSGSEGKTNLAFNDFIKRKDSFLNAFNNNKHILFTGSSLMLLGKKFNNLDGIDIFDFEALKGDKRISGDVVVSSSEHKEIVGFVNTSFVVKGNEIPYISIDGADDLIRKYNSIGYKKNNLLSINITGPLFVKNPLVLKEYVIKLGKIQNNNFEFKDTIKKNQYDSYNVTLSELKNRFDI